MGQDKGKKGYNGRQWLSAMPAWLRAEIEYFRVRRLVQGLDTRPAEAEALIRRWDVVTKTKHYSSPAYWFDQALNWSHTHPISFEYWDIVHKRLELAVKYMETVPPENRSLGEWARTIRSMLAGAGKTDFYPILPDAVRKLRTENPELSIHDAYRQATDELIASLPAEAYVFSAMQTPSQSYPTQQSQESASTIIPYNEEYLDATDFFDDTPTPHEPG